jgi:hypothetical protein
MDNTEKVINFEKAQRQNELLSDKTFDEIFSINDPEKRSKKIQYYKNLSNTPDYKCKTKFEKKLKQKLAEMSVNEQIKNTYIFESMELDIGTYFVDSKGIKDALGKMICQQIVYVAAIYKNMNTSAQKIELKFKNNFGWQTRVIDRAKATDKNKFKDEANFGIDVSNPTGLAEYINYILINNEHTIPYKKAVTHLGWIEYEGVNEKTGEIVINKDFLPYDDNIVFDGGESFRNYYEAVRNPKGDYETWRKNCEEFRKNITVRLAMDASFASPLLEITGSLPFVLLLYGKTGKGKTVTLQVAASIWGNPANDRLVNSLDSTKNFVYRTMGFYHSIPCFFDELQLYSGDKDKLAMTMCQGIDRGKADKIEGNKEKETWRNSAILSGEETISNSDSGGGTLNRLIEIDIDEESNGKSLFYGCKYAKDIEECKYASEIIAKKNYGFAGRIFIDYIRKLGKDKIFQMYQERFTQLKSLDISEDKQISTMANVLLADDIVNMFMFNETPLTTENVSKFLFSKKEIDKSERAYDFFIEEVTKNHFYFVKKIEGRQEENGIATQAKQFWGTLSEYEIMIIRSQFDSILESGRFPVKQTLKDWARKGYIELSSDGKYNIRTTIKEIGGGRINFVKVLPRKEEESFSKFKNGNDQLMPEFKEKIKKGEHLEHEDFTKQYSLDDLKSKVEVNEIE